jgi:hypothetical protein
MTGSQQARCGPLTGADLSALIIAVSPFTGFAALFAL